MPSGGDSDQRPSCRQLVGSAGFEPLKTSTSPSVVTMTHLSSSPSPASTENTAPNNKRPPLVAAPDSGMGCRMPPTLLMSRNHAVIEFFSMKNSRFRYFQT